MLLDPDGQVGMMFMSERKLYKLPGGGIEAGEEPKEAFLREVAEETGYRASIVHEFGYIEEHKKRNDFLQLSYCYAAKTDRSAKQTTSLSDSEIALGMSFEWLSLEHALHVMDSSLQTEEDYSYKFMLLRDKTILESFLNLSR